MITVSERNKRKVGSWGTIIYRTFVGIAMVILLKSIPIFIYDAAKWQKDIEDRTISTVELRIDLERHMAIWTLEAQASAFMRLKSTEEAIISLRKADSVAKIERENIRKLLSKIEINTRK